MWSLRPPPYRRLQLPVGSFAGWPPQRCQKISSLQVVGDPERCYRRQQHDRDDPGCPLRMSICTHSQLPLIHEGNGAWCLRFRQTEFPLISLTGPSRCLSLLPTDTPHYYSPTGVRCKMHTLLLYLPGEGAYNNDEVKQYVSQLMVHIYPAGTSCISKHSSRMPTINQHHHSKVSEQNNHHHHHLPPLP
jgi:hypothetical protein